MLQREEDKLHNLLRAVEVQQRKVETLRREYEISLREEESRMLSASGGDNMAHHQEFNIESSSAGSEVSAEGSSSDAGGGDNSETMNGGERANRRRSRDAEPTSEKTEFAANSETSSKDSKDRGSNKGSPSRTSEKSIEGDESLSLKNTERRRSRLEKKKKRRSIKENENNSSSNSAEHDPLDYLGIAKCGRCGARLPLDVDAIERHGLEECFPMFESTNFDGCTPVDDGGGSRSFGGSQTPSPSFSRNSGVNQLNQGSPNQASQSFTRNSLSEARASSRSSVTANIAQAHYIQVIKTSIKDWLDMKRNYTKTESGNVDSLNNTAEFLMWLRHFHNDLSAERFDNNKDRLSDSFRPIWDEALEQEKHNFTAPPFAPSPAFAGVVQMGDSNTRSSSRHSSSQRGQSSQQGSQRNSAYNSTQNSAAGSKEKNFDSPDGIGAKSRELSGNFGQGLGSASISTPKQRQMTGSYSSSSLDNREGSHQESDEGVPQQTDVPQQTLTDVEKPTFYSKPLDPAERSTTAKNGTGFDGSSGPNRNSSAVSGAETDDSRENYSPGGSWIGAQFSEFLAGITGSPSS